MKKIIIATFIGFLFLTSANGQKISKDEARQYLERVWGYLKAADSASYKSLWPREDSVWQKYHAPMSEKDIAEDFKHIRGFLRVALSENDSISYVSVGKEDTRGTEINAYIKTKEGGSLGFSLHVIYLKDKWIARGGTVL